MQNYIKRFISDESGMELIQWLIIILVGITCGGIALVVGKNTKNTLNQTEIKVAEELEQMENEL